MGTTQRAARDGESDDLVGPGTDAVEAIKIGLRAAHRLNNIVTVIMANTHVLLATHDDDSEVGQCAAEIREAADRAAELSEEMFMALRRRP